MKSRIVMILVGLAGFALGIAMDGASRSAPVTMDLSPGFEAYNRADLVEATRFFSAAVQADFDNPTARCYLAASLLYQDQPDDALMHAEAAAKLVPGYCGKVKSYAHYVIAKRARGHLIRPSEAIAKPFGDERWSDRAYREVSAGH